MTKTFTFWQGLGGHEELDAGSPGAVAHQGHVPGVATELVNVLLDPVQSGDLWCKEKEIRLTTLRTGVV